MSPLDYLGVHIDTIVEDNVSIRCDGCLEVIDGTPWRMNILDVVAAETPVSWAERPPINPGRSSSMATAPTSGRGCARAASCSAARARSARSCGPIPIPGPEGAPLRYGLCDGLHRDDHELVPA